MANKTIKTMEELVNRVSDITAEDLASIVNNEQVDTESLTDREKLAVLVYNELAKALNTKDYALVMDCNYERSGHHNHSDEAKDVWLVDYLRYVAVANRNATLIQIYVRPSVSKGTVTFNLCTSCALPNREAFEALEDDLHFTVKWDKEHKRAKTSTRLNIAYTEIIDVVKAVCAVLASTKVEAEKAKAAKAKEAADKKAAAKAEKAKEKAAKKKSAPKKKSSKKSAKSKTEEVPQTDDPLEDITE